MKKIKIDNKDFGIVKIGTKPIKTLFVNNTGDERLCIGAPETNSGKFNPQVEYLCQDESGKLLSDENGAVFDAVCKVLEPRFPLPPGTIIFSDANGFLQDENGKFNLLDLGFGVGGVIDLYGNLKIMLYCVAPAFFDEDANKYFADEDGAVFIDVCDTVFFSDENDIIFEDEESQGFSDI